MNFQKLGKERFTREKLERLRATNPELHKKIAPCFRDVNGGELRLPATKAAQQLDAWWVKEETHSRDAWRAKGFVQE